MKTLRPKAYKEVDRKWTRNGMREIIDTPLKAFNLNNACLSNGGNVVDNNSYSKYIRGENETECYGNVYDKGHLRNYDLNSFDLAEFVTREEIKNISEDTFVLVEYRHYIRFRKVVLGYVAIQNDRVIFNKMNPHLTKKQAQTYEWIIDYLYTAV